MKTYSYIYGIMSIVTFMGGSAGITHQFYLSVLCVILSVVLYPWKRKEANDDIR